MKIYVRYLALFSSFLSNRWFQVVLDGMPSQEYPLNAGVPQGSILDPTFFLLYINDLPDDVICNIVIYANDILFSTLSLIRHLIHGFFDWSNNIGTIDVKMDGSVLEIKSSFKMLGLTFSSKLDWGSCIIWIAKTASKKIGALICSFSCGCSVSL